MDERPPPQAIAPGGSRFYLDHQAHYVQWMDFSFYMAWTWTRGWAFYDIRHKGQRILYELSLQEALAHYAGDDPAQSSIFYRDASIGMVSQCSECGQYFRRVLMLALTMRRDQTS